MKISLTSLDIAALTAELNQRLQGSRLNNVYYLPDKLERKRPSFPFNR